MPKYRLVRFYRTTETVEVEANNEYQAKTKAEDDVDPNIKVLHDHQDDYEVDYRTIREVD